MVQQWKNKMHSLVQLSQCVLCVELTVRFWKQTVMIRRWPASTCPYSAAGDSTSVSLNEVHWPWNSSQPLRNFWPTGSWFHVTYRTQHLGALRGSNKGSERDCEVVCCNGPVLRSSSVCQRQRGLRGLDKYQGYLGLYCIQSRWACAEVLRHRACAVKLSVCKRQRRREATKEPIMWEEGHLIARPQTVCGVNTEPIGEHFDDKMINLSFNKVQLQMSGFGIIHQRI